MNWSDLGRQLRQSAEDAHEANDLPDADLAYEFLLENPECFGVKEWPDDMPSTPSIELVTAYYRVGQDETA